jgi:RAB protein geranylgeranyltransferase component A
VHVLPLEDGAQSLPLPPPPPRPSRSGSNRDYNVDLVPKFIMACGNLVKILLHTKV